jgi:hypothetical protein
LLVVDAHERDVVLEMVRGALDRGAGWNLVSFTESPIIDAERAHADRLLTGPRR